MPFSCRISCFFLATLATLPAAHAEPAEHPNVVIILADDLGYGDVGCFGGAEASTPHIDSLAADGMRFTDFHSNGAVCSPTRAALLTGRYQQRTGITGVVTAAGHRHTGLDLSEVTFAEVMKTAGYRTGLFGKWHVGYQPKYNPVRQGFDEFAGYVSGNVDYYAHMDQTGIEDWWKQDSLTPDEGYTTDLITQYGIDFIKRNRDKPFVLYLAHEAPHYPYQKRGDPQQYKLGKGITRTKYTPGAYEAMIEAMDEGIGLVRKTIEDAGLAESTLIFFFSDNGPAGPGSAGVLRGKKSSIWEGGHRVPAAACWPGTIKPGSVSDQTAMGADLLPTMAAIAGAPLPDGVTIDGVNLLGHMTRGETLAQRPLYWGVGGQWAVRSGDDKLITNRDFSNPQLYNLAVDLREEHNVADQYPEKVQQLLEMLKAWRADVQEGVKKRT